MDLLRTLIWFIYFFGYMLVHRDRQRRAEAAMAAGDEAAAREIVHPNVLRWCNTLIKLAGVKVTVRGRENLPDGPAVFVANHRSYWDIPLMLTGLDRPHGILAKEATRKIPLVHSWMELLGCVYVDRDDARASVKALNEAAARVRAGHSFIIFPEGTRNKGAEGTMLEFKAGAFRIAAKSGAAVVPVVIRRSRDIMENNHMLMHPTAVEIEILPAIETAGADKAALKTLPERVRAQMLACLAQH